MSRNGETKPVNRQNTRRRSHRVWFARAWNRRMDMTPAYCAEALGRATTNPSDPSRECCGSDCGEAYSDDVQWYVSATRNGEEIERSGLSTMPSENGSAWYSELTKSGTYGEPQMYNSTELIHFVFVNLRESPLSQGANAVPVFKFNSL